MNVVKVKTCYGRIAKRFSFSPVKDNKVNPAKTNEVHNKGESKVLPLNTRAQTQKISVSNGNTSQESKKKTVKSKKFINSSVLKPSQNSKKPVLKNEANKKPKATIKKFKANNEEKSTFVLKPVVLLERLPNTRKTSETQNDLRKTKNERITDKPQLDKSSDNSSEDSLVLKRSPRKGSLNVQKSPLEENKETNVQTKSTKIKEANKDLKSDTNKKNVQIPTNKRAQPVRNKEKNNIISEDESKADKENNRKGKLPSRRKTIDNEESKKEKSGSLEKQDLQGNKKRTPTSNQKIAETKQIVIETKDDKIVQKEEKVNNTEKDVIVATPLKKNENISENRAKRSIKRPKRFSSPSPIKKRLRIHSPKNYEDKSFDKSSKIEEQKDLNTTDHHLPVYKQVPLEDKMPESKEEIYEFDSDSEKPVKKKTRKRKPSETDHKVETNNKKVTRKKKKGDKKINEYDKNINNVLNNVRNKINKRRELNSSNDETNNNKIEKSPERTINNINNDQNLTLPHQNNTKAVNITLQNNELNTTTMGQTVIEHLSQKPLSERVPSPDQTFEYHHNEDINPSKDKSMNELIESDFDFQEKEETPKEKPRINIISNVTLRDNQIINLRRRLQQPNKPRSWRFQSAIFRPNPYILSLKESGLPNLSQDLVLDHSVVDKFMESISTNQRSSTLPPPPSEGRKTPVQKTLLDYYGNEENKENQENNYSTLFDENYFSPLKRDETTPKKVLMPKNNNLNAFSTPLYPNTHKDFTPDLSVINDKEKSNEGDENSCFGFNNSTEDQDKLTKVNSFRVPSDVKKYNVKKRKKQKVNSLRELTPPPPPPPETPEHSDDEEEMSDNEVENKKNNENKDHEIGLFEDYDVEEHITKIPKRKPKWMKNLTVDEDSHEYKTKRKRRDIRTKEEEEEAEKWAQSFNAMCEEIEKYPLEIE